MDLYTQSREKLLRYFNVVETMPGLKYVVYNMKKIWEQNSIKSYIWEMRLISRGSQRQEKKFPGRHIQ